jgi:hypothetical protein
MKSSNPSAREGWEKSIAPAIHTVAALNHPYICQLYDTGSDYLVLVYVKLPSFGRNPETMSSIGEVDRRFFDPARRIETKGSGEIELVCH